jgi:hypothetical protein
MNYDHDTGRIDSLLTIDTTVAPPSGGATGSLAIIGTGALFVPTGTTAQQPANAVGQIRFNTTTGLLETNNGTTWNSAGGGSVSSVSATGSTGLTVGGSPITSTGTLTFTLSSSLQALSTLGAGAGTGLVVQTGAGTFTDVTITGTASNIVVTNGTGVAGNPTINLATVTDGGGGTFKKITTDGFGRVTGTSAVVAADITTLVDATYVNVSGDSMSSAANLTFSGGGEVLGLPATPTTAGSAASKAYVDSVAQGLDPKASVRAATTTSGTLASSFANGSAIDGITLATGDRILIKNQAAPAENGIYTVNASGAPTRALDMDNWLEFPGSFVFIEVGSTLADTAWVCTSDQGGTLGTTAVSFVQFGGSGTYTAGSGLTLTGTQFSITTPITVALGGTGLTTTPSNGNLLIGNGTNYTLAGLTQGTGITVTNGAGSITITNAGVTSNVAGTGISVSGATGAVTITNTGVTSVAGTANQIAVSASTGAVTFSLPSAVTLPGTLIVTTSATISGLTANSFLYSGTAGLLSTTAAPTNGQLLIGSTGAAPVAAALTQGTGITVTNGAGSITIANAGVTSNVAGTGISVSGATGAVTITNTGVTSIVAGTGVSISGATGAVTVNNTGVTSVALSVTGPLFTVSGSPVTTTGTLTATLNTQTTNTVLIAPNGSTGAPTFRQLVLADLTASALKLYTENPSTPTAPVATGANATAQGSGASATLVGQQARGAGIFTGAGDAQKSLYILRNSTTNATATELFTDGSASRLVMPNNSAWTFTMLIVGRRTDATGGAAGYQVSGVIRKDTTAGSTALVGAVTKAILGETNAAWDVTVTADTTNGSLRVQVTGEAAKTIRWVASVDTVEVTN